VIKNALKIANPYTRIILAIPEKYTIDISLVSYAAVEPINTERTNAAIKQIKIARKSLSLFAHFRI
jgi:hypothetical protein